MEVRHVVTIENMHPGKSKSKLNCFSKKKKSKVNFEILDESVITLKISYTIAKSNLNEDI
jgi:hypothetical protein